MLPDAAANLWPTVVVTNREVISQRSCLPENVLRHIELRAMSVETDLVFNKDLGSLGEETSPGFTDLLGNATSVLCALGT